MINDLNATWVRAANRLSPRVIADLYQHAIGELSDLIEAQRLDEPAIFPVSWAGEHEATAQWLDIGREFTEVWHHGSQIRDAVGAGPFTEARWLHAVLQIAMHAMPFAYREVRGAAASIVLDITGPGGGCWTMTRRSDQGWDIEEGSRHAPSMKATMTGEAAWKLLFNALPADVARKNVAISGDATLAPALFAARSVIV